MPGAPSDLTNASIGGEFRYWFTPTLGLQLEAIVAAPTRFGGYFVPSGYITPIVAARERSATAQLLFTVARRADVGRLWLGVGASAVQHYGAAFAPYGDPTAFGVALGVGGTLRVHGDLNVQGGLTSLMYSMPTIGDRSGNVYAQGSQTDLQWVTGLGWGWH